jgi:tetratricopeptide (TPR) repeat protein
LLHTKQGRSAEAAAGYQAALKIKPEYEQANLSLGALLASQKKYDEAIRYFYAALATEPGNVDAHFNVASALSAKGEYGAASVHYAEACRLRPADVEAREGLGFALLCQGRMPEAVPQFEQVLRERPSALANYHLAVALDSQGQSEGALAHYREAVRLAPDAALYLNDLAWLLATSPNEQIRNGAEAVRLAERACELSGGKEARFFGTLDAAYAEAGRFEEAMAAATKARDLALAAGQKDIAQKAEERLALYREHKPYRTPAPPGRSQ